MARVLKGTELTEEQHEYLTTVMACSNSLLTLINDILDFSKIEAGKMELDATEFALVDLVESVVDMLGHRALKKGLEFICHVSPNAPAAIRGDPGRLRQVLVNLAGNAIKFTESGEVVVSVKAEAQDGDRVGLLLQVRDTGIGIARDRQDRIFGAFTQADGATTRRYGGTGLGLAISKHIVALMDGEIWVESEEGCGSTFSFRVTCPVVQQDEGRSDETDQSAPVMRALLSGKRVLVVDDNTTNRRILEQMLAPWGCRIESASGGADALETLRQGAAVGQPFNLVVLDVQMPQMDGFEVEHEIRTDSCYGDPRVIFLSSLGHRRRAAGPTAAANVYLEKPVRQSMFLRAIAEVLSPQDVPAPCEKPGARKTEPRSCGRRARILLVEDTAVNRQVATRLLEKCNCDVTTAENGAKALQTLESQSFDLVFMDVQMPEMDGLLATRHIRADARWRTLPVVAMTAHALKGDRERCLEAGMDDYISKPVRGDQLRAMVDEWVPSAPPSRAQPPRESGSASGTAADPRASVPLDVAGALTQLGNDHALLDEVLTVFLDNAPDALRDLQAAVSAADAERLHLLAHGLKGAASSFCAEPTRAIAEQLERVAKQGNLQAADSMLEELQRRLERLQQFAASMKEQSAFSRQPSAISGQQSATSNQASPANRTLTRGS